MPIRTNETFKMPAGRYFVGDLCYVMHPQWKEVCKNIIVGPNCVDGQFTLKNGVRFTQFRTEYGDGRYADQLGNEYPVDAGLIGCILVDDISDPKAWMAGGNIIDFSEDFECSGKEGGTLIFGHISIETGDDEDFEDDEFDEENF